MKLFSSPTSPFVRKVLVLIRESGMKGIENVAAAGNPVAPGSMPVDHNPLGKIPALLTDDDRAIFDSRVICRFLDSHFDAGFYPKDDRLWDTLTLEAMSDGILEAAVLIVYESRLRPEEYRFAPWTDGQWAKIDRALNTAETRWMPVLSGPPDMGQIAMGCALGYLDFRHGAQDWRPGRPNLAAWYKGFSARTSMQETAPKG
jgi:glutathione S-transferase